MMFISSLLLQGVAPRLAWNKVTFKYVGFLAHFAIFGALGFRFLVLRARTAQATQFPTNAIATLGPTYEVAEHGAVRVGLIGVLLLLANSVAGMAWKANAGNINILDAVRRSVPEDIAEIVLAPVLLIAFLLALRRTRGAWLIGALAGLALALRNIVTGRWVALINPLHEFSAAIWLGTLFVLVIAGLPAILRSAGPIGGRGPLVAELVGRFSPLALVAAAVLGLTGLVTS